MILGNGSACPLLIALSVSAARSLSMAADLGSVWHGLTAPVRAIQRDRPKTGQDDCVEQLATEIDWLEHHIDRFGSIVAKQPDVWGQSRM